MQSWGDQFRAQQTPGWSQYYLRYDALKAAVYSSGAEPTELSESDFTYDGFAAAAGACLPAYTALRLLDTELSTASTFFVKSMGRLMEQMAVVQKLAPSAPSEASLQTPLLKREPTWSSTLSPSPAGSSAVAGGSAPSSPLTFAEDSVLLRSEPAETTTRRRLAPLSVVVAADGKGSAPPSPLSSTGRPKKKSHGQQSMKRTVGDLYREATLLKNFQMLNYAACVKLLKKLAAKFGAPLLEEKGLETLHTTVPLSTASASLNQVLDTACNTYASLFTEGDVHIAQMELLARRTPPINWDLLQLGLRMGISLSLFIWAMWDVVVDSVHHKTEAKYHDELLGVVPVFRAVGAFVLIPWLWALDLIVWRTARVNYLFILESDVKNSLGPRDVITLATSMTIWFFVLFLLYFKSLRHDAFEWLPPHVLPLVLVVTFLLPAVFPWSQRKGLWLSVLQVLGAPFTEVRFRHTFIADIMTSMPKIMADLAYTMCFFVSGQWADSSIPSCSGRWGFVHVVNPLIHSLPLWLRFMQNIRRYRDTQTRFPHLANALKYALAQSVGIFAVMSPSLKRGSGASHDIAKAVWVMLFIMSTLYTFSWDVTMDWGLGNRKHGWLRSNIMYRRPWLYFAAIAADFVLRFLWTFQLIPGTFLPKWAQSDSTDYAYWVTPIIAYLELCRRAMWASIRLENEHVSNTFQHRRADFVPLHFDVDHRAGKTSKNAGRRVLLEAAAFVVVVVVVTAVAVVS